MEVSEQQVAKRSRSESRAANRGKVCQEALLYFASTSQSDVFLSPLTLYPRSQSLALKENKRNVWRSKQWMQVDDLSFCREKSYIF